VKSLRGCGQAESKEGLKFVLRTALRPNQIEFSHSLGHNRPYAPQKGTLLDQAGDYRSG
jgi:hypothetical protein